jgi:hypothetical protein
MMGAEWRDPEDVSSAMLRQGVLSLAMRRVEQAFRPAVKGDTEVGFSRWGNLPRPGRNSFNLSG